MALAMLRRPTTLPCSQRRGSTSWDARAVVLMRRGGPDLSDWRDELKLGRVIVRVMDGPSQEIHLRSTRIGYVKIDCCRASRSTNAIRRARVQRIALP